MTDLLQRASVEHQSTAVFCYLQIVLQIFLPHSLGNIQRHQHIFHPIHTIFHPIPSYYRNIQNIGSCMCWKALTTDSACTLREFMPTPFDPSGIFPRLAPTTNIARFLSKKPSCPIPNLLQPHVLLHILFREALGDHNLSTNILKLLSSGDL